MGCGEPKQLAQSQKLAGTAPLGDDQVASAVRSGDFFMLPNERTIANAFARVAHNGVLQADGAFRILQHVMGEKAERPFFDQVVANPEQITIDQLLHLVYVCVNGRGASRETVAFLQADTDFDEILSLQQLRAVFNALQLPEPTQDLENQEITFRKFSYLLKRSRRQ